MLNIGICLTRYVRCLAAILHHHPFRVIYLVLIGGTMFPQAKPNPFYQGTLSLTQVKEKLFTSVHNFLCRCYPYCFSRKFEKQLGHIPSQKSSKNTVINDRIFMAFLSPLQRLLCLYQMVTLLIHLALVFICRVYILKFLFFSFTQLE